MLTFLAKTAVYVTLLFMLPNNIYSQLVCATLLLSVGLMNYYDGYNAAIEDMIKVKKK